MTLFGKIVREVMTGYYKLFPAQKIFFSNIQLILDKPNTELGRKLSHVAFYVKKGNAGDILLPVMVRDLIQYCSTHPIDWNGLHAHAIVTNKKRRSVNDTHGLIIGGGGLFLADTNKNNQSGWQWSCSVEQLSKMNVPLAVFAVGYNRFRGQNDFEPVFTESVKLLTEKSVFIGLRNHGSIKAIKTYLPDHLHDKIRFQPCPTTVAYKIYPDIVNEARKDRASKEIALNYADDRIQLRLGEKKEAVLNGLANAMKKLENDGYSIKVFAHHKNDEKINPYLDKARVNYKIIRLYHMNPAEILEVYSRVTVAVGMRGHAQMIPFGCTTPIVSLISHDKLAWFLQDIERPQWGIEMLSEDFEEGLQSIIRNTVANKDAISKDMESIQEKLFNISHRNVQDFNAAL